MVTQNAARGGPSPMPPLRYATGHTVPYYGQDPDMVNVDIYADFSCLLGIYFKPYHEQLVLWKSKYAKNFLFHLDVLLLASFCKHLQFVYRCSKLVNFNMVKIPFFGEKIDLLINSIRSC